MSVEQASRQFLEKNKPRPQSMLLKSRPNAFGFEVRAICFTQASRLHHSDVVLGAAVEFHIGAGDEAKAGAPWIKGPLPLTAPGSKQ